ncbi:unnamed protein product [Microthlaspi erraticum]|uniref:Arabidopsis retrotransposon Orf1 C-terminal domain-containing protein n=1 Tax=Microthlaspi erraticum TaxID=1685480 RepID=A0A6D2LAI7_9BRAS|nr:unnamed protein product [Microthlaspi erraticum]
MVGLAQPMPKKLSLGDKGASSTDSSIELETRATRSSSTTRPRGYVYSEEESESERLREERRTKKRNDPISSESEQGEFEIGVNLVQEEGNGSPSEEGSDETESEEEGEEVNQLVERVSKRVTKMNLWRRLSHKRATRGGEELPMYQEHYNALFSMDFMDTKYPHVDTMKALGIFEDVELGSQEHALGQALLLSHGILQGAHLRVLSFNEAVGILFGFNYGEGTKWNFKEKELQRVWATIADGVYSSSRSKAAQIRSPVLRYVHKALANTFFARKATGTINEGELKFLDMGIKPILSRTSDGKRIRGDRSDTGNLMPFLDHLLTYKITAYNTRHQRGRRLSVGGLITPILCAAGVNPTDRKPLNQFTHPLVGPSKFLLPNPELTTVVRGENIDFRPPVYTLVGHEDDLREEEPELDRAEDRAEDQVQEVRIWVSLSAITLRSMRLQG